MKRTAVCIALALVGALVARAIAHYALRDVPHVMDEFAYLLQAETLLDGHVAAPARLPRAAFTMWFVDDRAATFGIFPPGWPAVLALGVAVGLRAWVNPLLHFATSLVVGGTARRLAGARAAMIATAVWALSPQTLVLAASLMSHALVALCASVVAYAGVSVCVGRPRTWAEWLGGAALGGLALTRPLCAVAVGVGLVALLVVARARRHLHPLTLVHFAAPALAACLALGAYNRALTGQATRFPQSAYFDEHAPPIDSTFFRYGPGCNDLGFGPGHGCDLGIKDATHTLANALSNTGDNLHAWGLLVGPFVLGAFAWAVARALARRRALDVVALALAATPLAAILLYALYWYAGTCYGARFYHAGLVAVVVVGAAAIARVRRAPVLVGVACARLATSALGAWGASREMSGNYWGNDDRFARAAAAWGGPPALVMVAFRSNGLHERRSYPWTSFLREPYWQNGIRALGALSLDGPRLDRRVVFAKYHPALVAELRARLPDREAWLWIVDDDARDELVPYDGSPYAHDEAPPPKDNFDGYLVDR